MKCWCLTLILVMNLLHPALTDDCNLELTGGSPLEDCDIFKKKITLNFDRMFQKPACLTKVLVLMNEEIAAIENPDRQITLQNTFIDNCEAKEVEIMATDKKGNQAYSKYELQPMRCYKELFRNNEIPYKMAGENQITLDVKSPFNTMLSCLNDIQVFKDEQKVTDYEDGGIKIGLDRSQQQMLSVIYRMRGGTKALERKLIVPRAGNDIERF